MSPRPGAGALALAVALGAAHALWSLFQWTQLILARRGSEHFCGLGEPGSCAAVWDLPLASAIQGATRLPVAGWGLVWSAVAFALPLWALVRRANGHPLEPIWSAVLLTVLAGIASVVVLAGASLGAGEVCTTCVITYALVLAYAAVCLRAADGLRPAQTRRGALLALGATLVAFLALLYPGVRTPQGSAAERSAFLEAAMGPSETEEKPAPARESSAAVKEAPDETAGGPTAAKEKPLEAAQSAVAAEEKPQETAQRPVAAEEKPLKAEDRPLEVAKRSTGAKEESIELERKPESARLEELIARLSPELRQDLSDALAAYSRADRVPMRPARFLIGPSTAPVRITEFTDILCGHCATLQKTIALLREMLPSGSFALEPRQFPLDSECNPAVQMSSGDGVRCLAARAMICEEKNWTPFADALFQNARWLTKDKIFEIAAPFVTRKSLEECVSSPETQAKLRDDIEWALEHQIQGTPLVLVNGREVPHTLQFLYAIVLAEANPQNPAFAALPPPKTQARIR